MWKGKETDVGERREGDNGMKWAKGRKKEGKG
jgi:hypothetical protein